VQLSLPDVDIDFPTILPTFDFVANKDEYWPETKNQWSAAHVGDPRTGARPNPLVVAAYMEFGEGTIAAEHMTDFEWEFRKDDCSVNKRGYFAQEVLYRIYPFKPPELDVIIERLDKTGQRILLKFMPIADASAKVKLWIGNSDKNDIHRDLRRLSSRPRRGVDFEFLNSVTGIKNPGPLPFPIVPDGTFPPEDPGAGGSAGLCGPGNAGGA
jgi:hypothetical protein